MDYIAYVTPGARDGDRVEAIENDVGAMPALVVRVRARASDGQANAAVVAAVANYLHKPKRDVSIHRGHTSRTKVVRVQD